MALIRILVKEGLTGLYYVQNGADSRKSSPIDPTEDNGQIWPNMGLSTIFGKDNFTSQFYVKKRWRFQKKQS